MKICIYLDSNAWSWFSSWFFSSLTGDFLLLFHSLFLDFPLSMCHTAQDIVICFLSSTSALIFRWFYLILWLQLLYQRYCGASHYVFLEIQTYPIAFMTGTWIPHTCSKKNSWIFSWLLSSLNFSIMIQANNQTPNPGILNLLYFHINTFKRNLKLLSHFMFVFHNSPITSY